MIAGAFFLRWSGHGARNGLFSSLLERFADSVARRDGVASDVEAHRRLKHGGHHERRPLPGSDLRSSAAVGPLLCVGLRLQAHSRGPKLDLVSSRLEREESEPVV